MRKEINLTGEVVTLLSIKAAKKKWSLKKYMEEILVKDAKKANIKHHTPDLGKGHSE